MKFGIMDNTMAKMMEHDLRQADFYARIGKSKQARKLRKEVDKLRVLDFEIREMQCKELGLI